MLEHLSSLIQLFKKSSLQSSRPTVVSHSNHQIGNLKICSFISFRAYVDGCETLILKLSLAGLVYNRCRRMTACVHMRRFKINWLVELIQQISL